MKSTIKRLGGAIPMAVALALGATAAHAQTKVAAEATPDTIQEVVVTGSRIVGPNIVATSPTQAISAEDIRTSGKVDISDIIAQLGQNVDQGLGQDLGNRTSGLSTPGGVATADLRGLGPNRTLVLVDGIRLGIGSPNTFILNPAPDLDQIPTFLLDRVDVVTGGASATYGSDAIAGVINFIMKKNFEGLQVDGQVGADWHHQHSSVSDPLLTAFGVTPLRGSTWDGQNRQFDVVFGTNFADGKGNVTAYLSYFDTDPVSGYQRDWDQCQFNPVKAADTSVIGRACGGSSNSNFFSPVNNNDDGNVYSVSGTSLVPQGSVATNPPAAFNSQPYIYLTRGDTRYTAGFIAHEDLADWAKPYTQFYFTDDRTHTAVAPGAIFNNTNIFDPSLGGYFYTNCSNPLLSAQEQGVLCTPAQVAADTASPGSAAVPIDLRRRNVEGGGRNSFYDHASYRAVLGSKGEFADGAFNYDAYGQFYYVTMTQSNPGYLNLTSVNNALLVTGTAASPTCISGAPCVPYNIWKDGGVTQDQLQYLYLTGTSSGNYTMRTLHGDVTADLGKYGIKLPTATDGIGFNVGVEHRNEQQVYAPDSAEQSGLMLGAGAAAVPLDVGDSVTEEFAELRVPLMQDRPWAKDLVFDTGVRFSDYSITGKVTTDKFEMQWAPSADIRFRAGFQRAIRAPSLIELFNPQNVALVATGSDPCATKGTTPTATLAQCLNSVPDSEKQAFTDAYNHGLIPDTVLEQGYELSGGNLNLKPEVSKSWNAGFNLTPAFLPDFNASIDYFHIKLDDEIGVNPIQNIISGCNDGNQLECSQLVRNHANFSLNGPSVASGGYVIQTNINIATALVSGVDVQLNYKLHLPAALGTVALQMFGTYSQHNTSQVPLQNEQDCSGLYGPTCLVVNPKWRHTARVTWNMPWDASLAATWRYIGKVTMDNNDSDFDYNFYGAPNYVNGTIPGYSYFDLAATWSPMTNVELRAGINNMLDKDPPLAFGGAAAGYNTYTAYDMLGRQLFLGFTVKL